MQEAEKKKEEAVKRKASEVRNIHIFTGKVVLPYTAAASMQCTVLTFTHLAMFLLIQQVQGTL
jgi:hypothetical protein